MAALTTKPVIGVPCGGRQPYFLLSIAVAAGVPAAPSVWTVVTTPVTSRPKSSPSPTRRTRPVSPGWLDPVERVKVMDREVNGGA